MAGRFIWAAAFSLLMASQAPAALAPNYQRLAELKAVIAHPGVAEAFPVSHPIERVELVSTDLYRVTAGPCSLDVKIVNKPVDETLAGPRQFEAVPGQVTCGQ